MVTAVKRSARKPQKRSPETAELLDSAESDFVDDDYESAQEEAQTQGRRNKRQHRAEPDPNFLENAMYLALSNTDAAVSDLALEWVEQCMEDFETGRSGAITQLFNLILRCCGCFHLAQEHDMINSDSAEATVADIAVFFARQGAHEYPFISKNKDLKFFRDNVVELFEHIVLISHEKGCLYKDKREDDSSLAAPMMSTILAWLCALSGSTVRPFRLVSTTVLLAIQSQICEQAVSLCISLEKQLRQLNITNNNKTRRNQKAQEKKIETISETIKSFKLQHETLLEYLEDIFRTVFIHRYRDIDSTIRIECLKALGHWMMTYEAIFFQAKYLRYLGWLLSDPADNVREETVKVIQKLYKYTSNSAEAMNIGLRKFTDRFKKQFVSMVWKEKQTGIKVHLFGIYKELLKLGFFDDSDLHDIGLFGFYLSEMAVMSAEKIKKEWCKFAEIVCSLGTESVMEQFKIFLSTHTSDQFGDAEGQLKLPLVLQYKHLVDFLAMSYSTYLTSRRPMVSISAKIRPLDLLISDLFKHLYLTQNFQNTWETILRLILCDMSSVSFKPKEQYLSEYDDVQEGVLKEKMDISKISDKHISLSLFHGAIMCIVSKKSVRSQANLEVADDINSVFSKLALFLPDLENYLSKSVDLYVVYMRLMNTLLTGPISLARTFANLEKETTYNGLHSAMLTFFARSDEQNEEIQSVFSEYLSVLLQNSEALADSRVPVIINSNISMKLEDLVIDLTSETIEALSENEPLEDPIHIDDELEVPPDQKALCSNVLKGNIALQKLCQIGKIMNINKFIAEPILRYPSSLLETLRCKFIAKVEFGTLIKFWPNNYLKILEQMESSWQAILSLVLSSLCWKLEDLMYASNDNSASLINIEMFLGECCESLQDISRVFVTISQSLEELHEVTSGTNVSMKKLIYRLVELQCIFAVDLGDAIVTMRTFYRRLRGRNTFTNFDEFFVNDQKLGAFINGTVSEQIQKALLNVFFIKEARLAKVRGVQLERSNLDDVNYDDYFEIEDCPLTEDVQNDENAMYGGTAFDSSDIEDEENDRPLDPTMVEEATASANRLKRHAFKEQSVWNIEKDLCVYLVKVLSLLKAGTFPHLVLQRLKLNGDILGGLFSKILTSHEEEVHADIAGHNREPLSAEVIEENS